MISPDKLQELINCDKQDLEHLLERSGYYDCGIEYCRFIGVNSDGGFVYEYTYYNDDFELETSRLHLKYDHNLLVTTAEF
jgi:hypothetical protein